MAYPKGMPFSLITGLNETILLMLLYTRHGYFGSEKLFVGRDCGYGKA